MLNRKILGIFEEILRDRDKKSKSKVVPVPANKAKRRSRIKARTSPPGRFTLGKRTLVSIEE
jgi:hypothetical protein